MLADMDFKIKSEAAISQKSIFNYIFGKTQ